MINQQRDRLQMFNPLPYRLLPNLMNVQSEREQIVERVRLQILELSYCAALNQMCEGTDSQSKPEVHGFVHEFMLFKKCWGHEL